VSIEYTEEDKQAWLAENPWDKECFAAITDTLGFHVFVLDRRIRELAAPFRWVLLAKLKRLESRMARVRDETLARYFRS
jgi:hypothetical protein